MHPLTHHRPPRPLLDKTGTRFGKLEVVSLIKRDHVFQRHVWLLKCDCGNEKQMDLTRLKRDGWESCRKCIPPLQS